MRKIKINQLLANKQAWIFCLYISRLLIKIQEIKLIVLNILICIWMLLSTTILCITEELFLLCKEDYTGYVSALQSCYSGAASLVLLWEDSRQMQACILPFGNAGHDLVK